MAKTELLVTDDYVAIDFETTGYSVNYCEPIEVAAVKVVGGTVIETLESLIKPQRFLPPAVTKKTGITEEMLQDQPDESLVIPAFMDFIDGFPVLGHNVCFDVNFLSASCLRLGIDGTPATMIDNLRISRLVFPDLSDHKQETVFECCCRHSDELPPDGRPHRSMTDALMARYNYETMKPMLVEAYGYDPESALTPKPVRPRSNVPDDPKAIVPTVEVDDSGPLYDMHVCFTGKLETMVRRDAWQKAVNLGATIDKSVSKKTDYLVVGTFDFCASLNGSKSRKLQKAETLAETYGSPLIISEDFFSELAKDV